LKITDLNIYSLDISDEMHLIAKTLKKKSYAIKSFQLQAMFTRPFSDDFADLIVVEVQYSSWKIKKPFLKRFTAF